MGSTNKLCVLILHLLLDFFRILIFDLHFQNNDFHSNILYNFLS